MHLRMTDSSTSPPPILDFIVDLVNLMDTYILIVNIKNKMNENKENTCKIKIYLKKNAIEIVLILFEFSSSSEIIMKQCF